MVLIIIIGTLVKNAESPVPGDLKAEDSPLTKEQREAANGRTDPPDPKFLFK